MRLNPGHYSQSDHDEMIEWIDGMKGVYQRVIDKHTARGKVSAADVYVAREHLKRIEQLELTIREHHEMITGGEYRQGKTRPVEFGLATAYTLYAPDGSILREIRRNGRVHRLS